MCSATICWPLLARRLLGQLLSLSLGTACCGGGCLGWVGLGVSSDHTLGGSGGWSWARSVTLLLPWWGHLANPNLVEGLFSTAILCCLHSSEFGERLCSKGVCCAGMNLLSLAHWT